MKRTKPDEQRPPDNPLEGLGEMLQSAMSGMKTATAGPKEWWHSLTYPDIPNFSVSDLMNWARSALFAAAIGGGQAVHESSWAGENDVALDVVETKVQSYIADLDGKLIYYREDKTNSRKQLFYIFSGGAILATLKMVRGTYETDPWLSQLAVELVGTTKAHMQLGKDILDACIRR